MNKKLLQSSSFAGMAAKMLCLVFCLFASTGTSFAFSDVSVSSESGVWLNSSNTVIQGGWTSDYNCSSIEVNDQTGGVNFWLDMHSLCYDGYWTYTYNGADVKDSLLSIKFTNTNGNTAFTSFRLKVDKTAPVYDTVVYSGSSMADNSAKGIWFKQAFSGDSKLTVSFSDATSGIKSYSYAGSTNTTGVFSLNTSSEIHYTGYCYVSDYAGNTDSVYVDYWVDGTGPTILDVSFFGDSKYVNPQNDDMVCFKKGDNTAKLMASISDAGSGLKSATFADSVYLNGSFPLYIATDTVILSCITAMDSVGNESCFVDYTLCVDGTAPAFVTNEAGKDIIDVIEEGSGLDSIAYSFDKLAWTKFSADSIPGFLNQDNIYLVAVDHVGNVSDTLSLFTIDNHSLLNAKDSTVIYVLLDSNNEPYMDKAMRHIDQNLFNDNQDISFVVLPESIQSIGKDAFSNSTVKVILSFAPQAPALDQPFANIDPEAIVLVPEELESVYESSVWNLYFDNDHIMPYAIFNDSTVTVNDIKKMLNREAVIEIGRTFYKDGKYNTISLPFSLSAAQLAQSPLAGYTKLLEFTSAKVMNYGKSDETLIINMSNADAIKAGHPYIIEWDSIGETIADPWFRHVTVTTPYATSMAQLDGAIMFFGTFTPFMVCENDMDFIFVDEKSQLSWPNKTNLFKAFRAYFQINRANPAGLRSGMAAIFGGPDDEEGTTRVLDLNSSDDASKARKLMLEGRVVIEKAGRYFDMTGKEIK